MNVAFRVGDLVGLPQGFSRNMAHHEAGHAVAALALGLPCHGARLTPSGGEFFLIKPGEERIPETRDRDHELCVAGYRLAAKVHDPERGDRETALVLGTLLMAGVQAELLHGGFNQRGCLWLSDADMLEARLILSEHWGGGSGPLYHCQREARRILKERWPEVERIADVLNACGRWVPDREGAAWMQ